MFNKIRLLVILNMLFFTANVFALDAKQPGELEVIVLPSASRDFIKEWVGASYTHAPQIQTVKEIERNQAFYVAVVVSGYGVDDKGAVNLAGDCLLLEPSGKVSFEDKGILKIETEKGGSAGGFLMFSATLEVVLEDSDPLGIYTVRAVVRDSILNKTATGECKITLKAQSKTPSTKSPFSTDEDFIKWINYYYLLPEPEKIPAAIKFYSDSALFNKVNARLTMTEFFAALFKNNSELVKTTYEDISATGSNNSKIVFLRALWLADIPETKLFINKAGLDWKTNEIEALIPEILNNAPPDIFKDPIKDAAQLDMLWAAFLATGDSAPVKRIISVLHLLKDGHGLEIVIAGAAQWSLASNAIQHSRVYEICKEELASADRETKKILQEIIDKAHADK